MEIRSSYVPLMDETFGDLRALIPSPRADEGKAIHHLAEERAFVLAATAFNQASVPSLHAEAYNILGKCLKLVSMKKVKTQGKTDERPDDTSRCLFFSSFVSLFNLFFIVRVFAYLRICTIDISIVISCHRFRENRACANS
jgi:hypothetical protein